MIFYMHKILTPTFLRRSPTIFIAYILVGGGRELLFGPVAENKCAGKDSNIFLTSVLEYKRHQNSVYLYLLKV